MNAPWKVESYLGRHRVRDTLDITVCDARDAASAALIAAAPAMLETLRLIAARWDKDDDADSPVLGKMLRAVIAAAEGSKN